MTQITSLDGTPLSALTFGAMQFGGKADRAASEAMYVAARGAGITHFDTAHAYTDGQSERWLGGFVAAERDTVIVASKAAYVGGSGRANLVQSVETSRTRLDFDVIDILYLHRFDPATPLEETFETLAGLQQAGHIRYVGVSNFAAWQVVKAQGVAARLGTRIDIIQPMYNLVKRQAEVEIFPMAMDLGIEIAPYSPLGAGLLTGKYAAGGDGRLRQDSRYAARYGPDWMHETARALTRLAGDIGVDAGTLAVAWAMAHPSGPRPIISASAPEQLAPSLAAATFDMTPELYAQISDMSRTPAPATDRLEEA